MNYATGIFCAAVIIVALFTVVKIFDTPPEPGKEMEITLVDPTAGITTETADSIVFPYTPGSELAATDPNPSGPVLLDAKAWGYFFSDKFEDPHQYRKIRVDNWGRVTCAPQLPKIYPWDVQ